MLTRRFKNPPCGRAAGRVNYFANPTLRAGHLRTKYFLTSCALNKAESLESLGVQGQMALFKCKVFTLAGAKTLHIPSAQCAASMEIHIDAMAEFHKNGFKEPFLWNSAAYAARINRKAVYSVDITSVRPQRHLRHRHQRPPPPERCSHAPGAQHFPAFLPQRDHNPHRPGSDPPRAAHKLP